MPSIRQKNIAPGSGLGEIYLRTYPDVTQPGDYAENFVFPRATRIWLMEMGMSVANITGTSMAAEAGYAIDEAKVTLYPRKYGKSKFGSPES